jgi:phosphoribosylformylglycinamidine synthase subunit PurSL
MDFLHEGLPQRELTAVFPPAEAEAAPPAPFFPAAEPGRILLALLSQPDIRSKEDVIRRYDHEVQGGTVVRPLVGPAGQGPGDAAVLVPLDQTIASLPADRAAGTPIKGAALANGLCPAYSSLDPYAMAWAAVDEAFRNVVAVGADPEQVALLDNFCWGNPNLPDRLGGLVRCAQGCHDAAVAYNAPFISGKDSLNNEYTGADGRKHAIPGTLLISALAIVPEVNQTVTMDLKQAGNLLYLIGDTGPHLGGSQYQRLTGLGNNQPPQPVPGALDRFRVLHQAIRLGLIQACHDCSEGGLAVTLAEMCLAGGLGADIALDQVPVTSDARPDDETLLFSESLTRLIVEIRPGRCSGLQPAPGRYPPRPYRPGRRGWPHCSRPGRSGNRAAGPGRNRNRLARPLERSSRPATARPVKRSTPALLPVPGRNRRPAAGPDPPCQRHQPGSGGGPGLHGRRGPAGDRPHQPAPFRPTPAP